MNPIIPAIATLGIEGVILAQVDPSGSWLNTLTQTGAMGAMLAWFMVFTVRRLDRNDNTTASLARAIWTFLHDNSSNPRIREDAKKEADALSRVGNGNNNGGTGL